MSKTKPPKSRIPPHSLEAEQAVLGCCLRYGEPDAATIPLVASLIKSHYFYNGIHRSIYETILLLHECQQPVDIVTVANQLEATEDDGDANRPYLAELAGGVVTEVNVASYCHILKDKHSYRRLIDQSNKIINQAFRQVDLPKTIIEEATGYYFDIAAETIVRGFTRVGDLLPGVIEDINAVQAGTKKWGIPGAFPELNDLTGGYQKGHFILIAARPTVGKTAFMNCEATAIAKAGHSVGVFSLETGDEEYAMRAMCTEGGIDSMDLKRGKTTEKDWSIISETTPVLAPLPYFVESPTAMTINQIVAKAIAAHKEGRLDILFIDYLQCISGSGKQKEIVDVASRQLTILAKRLDIPVVGLCQINREIEKRRDKRPILSDLKDSGNLEQDAHLVIGLYRPEMYATKQEDKYRYIGKAEAIVLKNRNGPIGTVDLFYEKKFTRFENLPQIKMEGPDF